jgi:hypothetical protein
MCMTHTAHKDGKDDNTAQQFEAPAHKRLLHSLSVALAPLLLQALLRSSVLLLPM